MSFPIQPTEAVDSVARADIAAIELLTVALVAPTAGAGTKLVLKEPTAGGTSAVTIEGPALAANRTITLPDADVALADIATNTAAISAANARTAGLIAPTTTVGGYLDLKEGTDNGAHRVRLTGPNSLAADRAVTFPDADVDLGLIATSVQTVAGLSPVGGDVSAALLSAELDTLLTPSFQVTFPVSAPSIGESVAFPMDGAQVLRIQITPKGAAATTGTIAVKGGISSGGNTLLSTASVNLSTLTANTPLALTLTGTVADLQGDLGDFLEIVIDNSDAVHHVLITFGRA